MKFKNVKYVFLIFVILIVVIAVMNMKSKDNNKQYNEVQVTSDVVYQDNIRLGISNFDSINPLITKNKSR